MSALGGLCRGSTQARRYTQGTLARYATPLESPDPLIQLTTLSRIHLLAGSTNRELALPAATERTNVSRNQIVIASGDGASEFGN